jgi:hypothetical protein
MAAGYGIGPMREQLMIKTLIAWLSEYEKKRPMEVGEIDHITSLSRLHMQVKAGTFKDNELELARLYLSLLVDELNQMLNK